jgi:ribosomal protein L25 (general stress protein Ctc)
MLDVEFFPDNSVKKITEYHDVIWYKNGLIHRDNDLPAVIYSNGAKYWYQNSLWHRDNDLPAVVYPNGLKHWYQNGKLIK